MSTDARWGDESHLLGADGVEEHVRATHVVGGSFTPDAARIQPLRLVRGLLDVVLSRGARVAEGTRALRLSPRAVVTDHGTVRAPGWSARRGLERAPARFGSGGRPGVLAHDRDRAAATRGLGADRARPRARRSPTRGT